MPVSYVINRLGRGVRFLASSKIDVASYPAIDLSNNSIISFSLGFVPNSVSNGHHIFSKSGNLGGAFHGYFLLFNATGQLAFVTQNSSGTLVKAVVSNTVFVVGRIYHVTVQMTGNAASGWKIFVNGVDDTGTRTDTGDFTISNIYGLMFGSNRNSGQWLGYLYYLHIYNRVITTTEVKRINDKEGAVYLPNLVEAWNFPEKEGNVTIGVNGASGGFTGFVSTSLGPTNQHVNEWQQPILV